MVTVFRKYRKPSSSSPCGDGQHADVQFRRYHKSSSSSPYALVNLLLIEHAELYTRTKNAEAAKVEAQNKSDADLYSAQKTAEGVSAKAKAEAEATRLKGEADGAAEKAHGEGVAAGIKAQTEAYNGMENAYLLANRYIDVMPEVAEAVAKPLTAVDSIKMYGDGNATKLVRDTTGMVDQVTSGLKDATGIDLTELLSSFHQPFQPREDNE